MRGQDTQEDGAYVEVEPGWTVGDDDSLTIGERIALVALLALDVAVIYGVAVGLHWVWARV